MKTKLMRAAHAIAIIGVIAVLAWSKSQGMTLVVPYVPGRRNEVTPEELAE